MAVVVYVLCVHVAGRGVSFNLPQVVIQPLFDSDRLERFGGGCQAAEEL
jgi:hypothetical protein